MLWWYTQYHGCVEIATTRPRYISAAGDKQYYGRGIVDNVTLGEISRPEVAYTRSQIDID
jgi:hypothetical protein